MSKLLTSIPILDPLPYSWYEERPSTRLKFIDGVLHQLFEIHTQNDIRSEWRRVPSETPAALKGEAE